MGMNPRLLRPTASGFNPRRIAGLRVWLDPSQSSSVTLDSGISQINDLSGNGNHATQSTGADQPTYTNTQNGLNVMTFNGTSQNLVFASGAVLNVPTTVFAVVLSPSSAGAQRYIVARQSTGLNGGVLIRQDSTNLTSQLIDAASPFPTAEIDRGTGWGIVETTLTTSEAQIARNGGTPNVATGISGFSNNATFPTRIGRRPDTATLYWDSQMAEILIYDRSLTTAEGSRIRTYLSKKWGIALS
jgi:hypothetical protein